MQQQTVSILGTGNFSRSIAKRLLHAGHEVYCGSRYPMKRRWPVEEEEEQCLNTIPIVSIEKAITKSHIVILAVRSESHAELLVDHQDLLKGKILVDVSNPPKQTKRKSHAELLQEAFPECHVVKAFNTLSAFGLETTLSTGGSTTVRVCSDHQEAKNVILHLAGSMALATIDNGVLSSARLLEDLPRRLFSGWGAATITTALVWTLWFIYVMLRYYQFRSTPYTWHRFPVNTLQKVMACSSLTLLALCYLPGSLAAFAHMIYGTKYRRFPRWLDRWLKMRQQLGIYAFYLGLLHTLMAVVILNPAYFSKWYELNSVTVPLNRSEDTTLPIATRMNWYGELTTLFGMLGIVSMSIIAIASLPSVSEKLSWKETRFVLSYFGVFCLFLSTTHVTIKGMPDWLKDPFSSWGQGLSFLSCLLPWLTLTLRLLTWLPCCYVYVEKIRSGWEREVPADRSSRHTSIEIPSDTNHVMTNGYVNHALDTPEDEEEKTTL